MNKQRLLIQIFILYLTVTFHISCTVHDTDLSDQLERLMDSYHEVGQFQGAVLVSHNNKIICEKSYGEANREWHIQNTVDTKFRLGSATKPFTAVLIMKLVEEGKLVLSGKVSDYLPYYRTDTGTQVSIHHLLTHSSGISLPEMTTDDYWDFFQKRWSTRELVNNLCQGDLKFVPGTRFSYSSAGYILLGAIIEEVTGKTYEHVLSDFILDPYGLEDTGIDNPEQILPKRASGYQTNYGLGNARYKFMPSSHASGSLYSTVRDLYKWDQLLRSDDFLSSNTKRLMYTSKIKSHRGAFGYGWFIDSVKVSNSIQTRVFHAGDVSGFCALYVRVLESGDFVALLSNQEGLHYYDIAFSLLDLINGIIPEPPSAYLSDVIRYAYFSNGLEGLRSKYKLVQTEGLEHYKIDEGEINELGYDILTVGDIVSAIEVFKINIELHPNSSNAYDSLGEGYFAIGHLDKAIVNYEMSIKLNPENKNAIEMIESIREKKKH